MSKPRLLDLFCGAGGAAMGYHRAGFEVIGVDIAPQKNYPFEFHQLDVKHVLLEMVGIPEYWWQFDAIHASPPCQEYSSLRALTPHKHYPDLISFVRERLVRGRKPWVIENVMPAPLQHGIVLCGQMFGLRTYRHRRFETSWLMFNPEHPTHTRKTSTFERRRQFDAGYNISVTGDVGRWVGPAVMGIDWMNGNELSEAIPPAYTEYIGRHLMSVLKGQS